MMDECNICGLEVEDAEKCGVKEVGESCACCGRVLIARANEEDKNEIEEQ